MFYYIVFFILAIISLGELIEIPKVTKKTIYIIIMIFFTVLGGLRWRTGSDWFPYFNYYTNTDVNDPGFMVTMEAGFAYFVMFLRMFSQSFTFYLVALAVITVTFKAFFFYRFTTAIFLAATLYWCTLFGDMTAVRQAMAISICAFSIIYIVERKPWHFVILVVLAAQIHFTAYLFLVSYKLFLHDWSVKSKYLWLIGAVVFGMTVGSEGILEWIISHVPSGLGLDRVTHKAQAYMEIGTEAGGQETLSKYQRTLIAVLKRALLLPVFFIFQDRFVGQKKEEYNGFLNLYTFGNILYFVFIDFFTLQRAASYFYLFEILVFCIIFEQVKSKSVWILIILAYSLLKLIALLLGAGKLVDPYIWIFSENTFRYVS